MAEAWADQLYLGDCLEVLRTLPDASVDAVVTDPPYGLAFMGKRWDYDVPSVEIWAECLRVLKPGGHLLAFAGTRTQHRMAVRIEDAGFEIRDMIAWVYGAGFPKSLDVSKAIDKAQRGSMVRRKLLHFASARGIDGKWLESHGVASAASFSDWTVGGHVPSDKNWLLVKAALGVTAEEETAFEREVIGRGVSGKTAIWADGGMGNFALTAPATPEAQQWAGWGTALKPSIETVTWATKPFPPERERAKILGNLWKIEARLWLLSSASAAAQSSTSSQSEYVAACATAQWTADDATNTRAALRGLMDTWQCEMATHASLSIVSSWRRTLEESSKPGSTSTTETESRMTTDWKTLSCCLSEITPESIIQACSLPGGFNVNASTAAQIFNASLALLQSTLTLSAIEPATWQGLGARQGEDVRPSLDPVIMARKPLKGTVAANVLQWGTGGLNVDGCLVEAGEALVRPPVKRDDNAVLGKGLGVGSQTEPAGRWPANLIHDGSEEVVRLFPVDQDGSAARYFYSPKVSRNDRSDGNTHPTVKPTDLMRYLCRLVTPPGGIVLDPFMGSGSTGKAAMLEGFEFIGIEREAQYHAIAMKRIAGAAAAGHQTSLF